ncbi:MAG TPA: lactonase family protein [Aggregatilineales bacterium]|nr:lactonase family protein [Aggregatilineales bacterium]
MTAPQKQLVYVGTYTRPDRSEGIYIYEFDSSTGELLFRNIVDHIRNPSFLAFSKDQRYLYAVSELAEFSGASGGGISAFAVDPESYRPVFLNAQPTHGAHPCYVSVDASGKWVVVANYGSGNVTVLPVTDNGQLGEAAAVIQNQGSSIHRQQDAPHAHSAIFSPDQRFIFVADLGIDRILIFRPDKNTGQLIPHDPPSIAAAPGAGPRHLAFRPDGQFLYVANELDSTVSAYASDAKNGTLRHLQTLSSLPEDFKEFNKGADIQVTSSGRFLYASNRGHDSIAAFEIDAGTGHLTLIEIVPSGGQTPRNFAPDLTDGFLLVANQDSDNLVVFCIDSDTGQLQAAGHQVSVPSPVCVKVIAHR